MMSSVLRPIAFLGILPANFIRTLICWSANWPLSLAVGRTMTKIRSLLGSGSLSKATNCISFGWGGTANEDRADPK